MDPQNPQKLAPPDVFLERTPWDSVDERYYRLIPMDSPVDFADVLSAAVKRGESTAWKILVPRGEARYQTGIVIGRVENGRVKEFVIQAMYSDSTIPVLPEVGRQLQAIARKQGCQSIRTHTLRHTLARALVEFDGWRLTEVIMRKQLD
jgi:hypothetical protein